MIGQVYGSYRITRRIGEGGVGAVYEAEHIQIGRKAAVKVLLPTWSSNKLVVERFFNEARSSSMANHPGIVDIFDCGTTEKGRAFLVMELLEGEPLSNTLEREGQFSVRRMTSISRQIASALAAVHDKGIIHRDLKPDNIFMIADPQAQTGERMKILDFGVAKLMSKTHRNTFVGVMLGTPLYMSPEQCISSREADARSDVYSLGCMMFEMVCGRPPFLDDEASTLAMMHVEEPVPRPRSMRADLPANVESLILRTLAKDRDARVQSMGDLRAELDVVWGLLPSEGGRAQLVTPQPGIQVVLPPAHGAVPRAITSAGTGVGVDRSGPVPRATTRSSLHPPGQAPGTPGTTAAKSSDGPPMNPWILRLVTTLVVLAIAALLTVLFFLLR